MTKSPFRRSARNNESEAFAHGRIYGRTPGMEANVEYFFPNVEQRLKRKIPISPEFTALVTGHGKIKSYLHRFKLLDNPTCPCNVGHQTTEHLIYRCRITEKESRILQRTITASGGKWPPSNKDLLHRHLQAFQKFTKAIDFSLL